MSRNRGTRVGFSPGGTLLHRLHPLVKLGWLVSGTLAVFALPRPWVILAVLAALCGLWLLLSPGRVRGMRLAVGTALMLALLQVAFRGEGAVWVRLGPLRVTDVGLGTGVAIGGRFIAIVLMSYLFVLTTDPNALAYALMRAGVPYRFGFAMVTALRLVPVFEQEGEIVYRAQIARGVAYGQSGPRRWVTLARRFLLPLLVSALSKVDAMAISMEGRGFGQVPRRTFLREVRVTRADGIAAGLLVSMTMLWVAVAVVSS